MGVQLTAFACLYIIFICLIVMYVIRRRENLTKFGTFIINHSDPTKDLCQLALEQDLDEIEKHRFMLIEIVVSGDISTEEPDDPPKTK